MRRTHGEAVEGAKMFLHPGNFTESPGSGRDVRERCLSGLDESKFGYVCLDFEG